MNPDGTFSDADAISFIEALRTARTHIANTEVEHHLVGQVVLIGDRAVDDLREAAAQVSLGTYLDIILQRAS